MNFIWTIFTGFSSRAWLILAAVIAFAAWSGFTYHAGYHSADTAWQAKALEAQVEKLRLEIKTQKDADAVDDKLRGELTVENEQQKKVIDEYLEELKKRPDKCLLGDDAVRLQ